MAGNSLSRRRRRRWQQGLCSQCISVYSYLPLSACACVCVCVFIVSCFATFHWLRLASCDWAGCCSTLLSFRPHKLPHTDTGYVQQSFFCLLLFKERQWSSQSCHLQDWPTAWDFFFFLFSFHLAEIMAHRMVFVKGVHMICLMALYLPCQSRMLSSRRLERGETERAHI